MLTRKLADLEVNVIGMGTAQTFNASSSDDVAVRQRIIDSCIENDATFIDTSPMYGSAEKVLGGNIRGKRDHFQLATKVWCRGQATGEKQIARSFQLLGAEYIEVLQIHNLVDWRTQLPVLEDLKAEGRIGLIGITHHTPSTYPEMVSIMKTGRVDTVQIPYHVLERRCEEEILPLSAEMGIGVIVMIPLGAGRLVRGLRHQPDLSPLRELGVETWAQALLAWVIADERVGVAIPATTRPERISENARVGSLPLLSPEMRDYVSREAKRCVAPGRAAR